MTLKPKSFVRLYIAIFALIIGGIIYRIYSRIIFVQKQRQLIINNFYDADLENATYEESLQKKYTERRQNARKIMKMKAIIKQINLEQKIYNQHINDTLSYIIVIQVHSNAYLLRHLLNSLKVVQSIREVLLIFSHDVFNSEINKAVHTVNFCKYMQIFYPYSIQLHPNVFPGYCQGKNCEKSKTRNPVAAQKKHHWWWQMNQVFDHLHITQKHNGTILLLEENNYVTKDLILVLKWLENTVTYHCNFCEMVSLAAHKPNRTLYSENATISIEMWSETKPNIGIGFGKKTWASIKNWTADFCKFDDYAWDYTLKYIGSKHMDINFYFAAIDGPRVFRIEKCDENDFSCNPRVRVREVAGFIRLVNDDMFPWTVVTRLALTEDYYTLKPRGLFSDERDHELCIYFSENNVWY